MSLLLTGLLFAAPLSMSQSFTALQNIGLITMIGDAEATLAKPAATFDTTDAPGPWFNNTATGNSLAIVKPGDTVRFVVGSSTNTVHTVTSLLWPTGASDMPTDQPDAFKDGSVDITLSDAGLYVFVCKVHPFMLAAVIADDDSTTELDLGETVDLVNGINNLPTASDLALRLLRGFFVITTPSNWQVFNPTGTSTWDPSYPAAPILAHDPDGNPVSIPNLDSFLQSYFSEPVTLPAVFNPSTKGVGEVWVDTQYELTESKTKPGTVTAVDASSWQVIRKVALPEINMNNPHNMWTDKDQRYIYQTQWFDKYLTTFDRTTGKLKANTEVGEAPAHVMTRVDTDFVHVSLNGEDSVVELKPKGKTIIREIPIETTNDNQAQPHAHWMGHDGQTMVTPNSNTLDSTLYRFGLETQSDVDTGTLPIATGMMPDSSKYYVSNFLDNTISVVSLNPHEVIKQINLLADYDPIPLDGTNFADNDGNGVIAVGALPIQTPVSPNGKYVVTANTLTNTITIIDTDTDTLEKMLACDAGCHGVNFGAKNGGGYYAYVTSKFANTLIVVDIDPNNDGEADDAVIVGRIVLDATSETEKDDTISGYAGMGGQGVLPIPLVYNGWVQNLPEKWQDKLTDEQLDPLGEGVDDDEDDDTRPTVRITSPEKSPKNIVTITGPESGVTLKLEGTAVDDESGVDKVEVKVNDPATLQLLRSYEAATPTGPDGEDEEDFSTWANKLTFDEEGTYRVCARATDEAGNKNWWHIFVKVEFDQEDKD